MTYTEKKNLVANNSTCQIAQKQVTIDLTEGDLNDLSDAFYDILVLIATSEEDAYNRDKMVWACRVVRDIICKD